MDTQPSKEGRTLHPGDQIFVCSIIDSNSFLMSPHFFLMWLACRDAEFFSNMVATAALAVKRQNARGEEKCPVKAVNVLKAHGGSAADSIYVPGYALNCTVAAEGKLCFFVYLFSSLRSGSCQMLP